MERLEDRVVLSTISYGSGTLLYTDSSGVTNHIVTSLSSDGLTQTLIDTDPIVVDSSAAGIVTVVDDVATIDLATVSDFFIDTGAGTDSILIESTSKAFLIAPYGTSERDLTVTLGNDSNGLNDIQASVTISESTESTDLILDDSSNDSSGPKNVGITGSSILGILGTGVVSVQQKLRSLQVLGGNQRYDVTVDGTPSDSVSLNPGTGPAGVTFNALSASATVDLALGSGLSQVTVGGTGRADQVAGKINTTADPSATVSYTFNDTGDATARSVSVDATTVKGFGGDFTMVGATTLAILGGSGGNVFDVSNLPSVTDFNLTTGTGRDTTYLARVPLSTSVFINAQSGPDSLTIGTSPNAPIRSTSEILGFVSITGGSKAVNLTVDDSADMTPRTVIQTAASISGILGSAASISMNAGAMSGILMYGSSGGSGYHIQNSGGFGYIEALIGGMGDDTFYLSDGANMGVPGMIDGGGGLDTLDYSVWTTPVNVDFAATPPTATGVYLFTGIERAVGGSAGSTFTASKTVPTTLMGGSGADTFIVPADSSNTTIYAGGGADTLRFVGAGASDRYALSRTPTGSQAIVGSGLSNRSTTWDSVQGIQVQGGPSDTVVTVDFTGGNPIPSGGISYSGGGGTNNTLVLSGDLPGRSITGTPSFNNESYNATGPGAGNVTLDGAVVSFSGLSPVIDVVSAATLTVTLPASATNLGLTHDSFSGVGLTKLASADAVPAFESIAFGNKTNVGIVAGIGDTSVVVNSPGDTDGLRSLSITTGPGADYVNIQATPTGGSGVPATLNVATGNGSDIVAAAAAGLGGPLNLDPGAGSNTLWYDAANLETWQAANSISSGALPVVDFSNFSTIDVFNVADQGYVGLANTIGVREGTPFSGEVARFRRFTPTDGNLLLPTEQASDFTADIDWGDGTVTAGTIVANNAGGFSVMGTHVYKSTSATSLTVNVTHHRSAETTLTNGILETVETNGGSTATMIASVSVSPAPIVVTPLPVLGVEGTAIPSGTTLATFVDGNSYIAASAFSATIDWGDGSGTSALPSGSITSTGSAGGFQVVGNGHTYAQPGTYSVTLVITASSGAQAISVSTASIADAPITATGKNVTASDGILFTGQVAGFSDGDPTAAISDFTVSVNWGDGVVTPGVVSQPGGPGTEFIVVGSHRWTYGTKAITVTITDNGGSSAVATGVAAVLAAGLSPAGAPVNVSTVEGSSFTAPIAYFSANNPDELASQLSASVGWGDGDSGPAVIVPTGFGQFAVIGTHTYAHANGASQFLTITVADLAGGALSLNAVATVLDAQLTGSGAAITAVAGQSIGAGTIVGTLNDANPFGTTSELTALINWGDGQTTAGTLVAAGNPASGFMIQNAAAHAYHAPGHYVLTLIVSSGGGGGAVLSGSAVITDASINAIATTVNSVEGLPFSGGVASFTVSNGFASTSDFVASIDWGDGVTSLGTISQPGGPSTPFLVTASHTYGFGTFPTTTVIRSRAGTQAAVGGVANVSAAALSRFGPSSVATTEGQSFNAVVGRFTSANPNAVASDFAATVDWGDGTATSAGTIVKLADGSYQVIAGHAYDAFSGVDPYDVSVSVVSGSGGSITLASTAVVADAPIQASPLPLHAVEGTASILRPASFIDSNPLAAPSDFSVTIDWGDATTSTGNAVTVTRSGGSTSLGASFTVGASHNYTAMGTYVVAVTVADGGGSTSTTYTTVTVADAPLIGVPVPVVGTAGVALDQVVVATFTDAGGSQSPDRYSATIDWGDGRPASFGTITPADGGGFSVAGSHLYSSGGTYSVRVLITEEGGSAVRVVGQATISAVPIAIVGALDPASDTGVSNSDGITTVNQPWFHGTSGPGAVIRVFAAVGSGTPFQIGQGTADAGGAWTIRTQTALPQNAYVITATAVDPLDPRAVPVSTVLMGGSAGPELVVDTTGPKITETIFRPALGQILIAFQDFTVPQGGMTASEFLDGSFFRFVKYGKPGASNLVTGIKIIGSGTQFDPIEAVLTINKGRPLPSGKYQLTVKSGGVTDTAGNPLDGEFYGYLDSGNGKPGGDFNAVLVKTRGYVFAPLPTQSTVTPNNPPGKKPTGYPTGGSTVATSVKPGAVVVRSAAIPQFPAGTPSRTILDAIDLALSQVAPVKKSAKNRK